VATASFGDEGAWVYALALDPATRAIYAVGTGSGQQTTAVARFTPSGALDPTFGKGGEVTVSAGRPYTTNGGAAAAVDPSGRLVVAGSAYVYDSTRGFYASVGAIYRFTTFGALDRTFNGTGKVITPYFDDQDGWSALQIEPSGSSYQIEVAGAYDGRNAMALYNANGSIVSSFAQNGVATLDTTFIDGYYYTFDELSYAFEPNGQLVEMLLDGGTTQTMLVNRYNADGSPDTTFGAGGQVSVSAPAGAGLDTVTVDLSGRIVLGGNEGKLSFLTRLTAAGALDTTFGAGGFVTQDFGANGSQFTTLAVYPPGTPNAGEILAVGSNNINYSDLALALYQS
jgi:uncharacterized delta-60 repeat protein